MNEFGWISAGISLILALTTMGVTVGTIRTQLAVILKSQAKLQTDLTLGQSRLQDAVFDLTKAVALLTTASAVSKTQFEELERRLNELDRKLRRAEENITVLRTRSHLLSNKIQEMDPNWKPYTREQIMENDTD